MIATVAEDEIRNAYREWRAAEMSWQKAVEDINEAKRTWELAQAKFLHTQQA
jgi:hypothetical protein